MKGLVVKTSGNTYLVRPEGGGNVVACRVKGRFRLQGIRSTNPVAVGDEVEFSVQDASRGEGYITALSPRRNYIIRKAANLSKQSHILAANVDVLLLLCTMARPETSTTFIDRVLAAAEAYRVPVVILFNKSDELSLSEQERQGGLMTLYSRTGYPCFAISAATGQGMEALTPFLQGKVCLLAGHSGVGKSTLLNRLIPEAKAKTAAVSRIHGTGRHTTTFSALYPLPAGGALIDIPGIKGFGTFDFKPEEVSHYFREFFALSSDCRFRGCTHTHEPDCAVRRALDEGAIAPSRYVSYLSLLSDEHESKYRPPAGSDT